MAKDDVYIFQSGVVLDLDTFSEETLSMYRAFVRRAQGIIERDLVQGNDARIDRVIDTRSGRFKTFEVRQPCDWTDMSRSDSSHRTVLEWRKPFKGAAYSAEVLDIVRRVGPTDIRHCGHVPMLQAILDMECKMYLIEACLHWDAHGDQMLARRRYSLWTKRIPSWVHGLCGEWILRRHRLCTRHEIYQYLLWSQATMRNGTTPTKARSYMHIQSTSNVPEERLRNYTCDLYPSGFARLVRRLVKQGIHVNLIDLGRSETFFDPDKMFPI